MMYEVKATSEVISLSGQAKPVLARHMSVVSSDTSLVEAVRRGDREAFGQLYRNYAPMVHGILLARVPYHEVQDLMQDVFLLALKKLDSLRDGGAFGGWLAMIARNHAMNFRLRSRPTEELTEEVAQVDPCETRAHEILTMIRSLPEAYQETLVLRLVEGMSGAEIAHRTGLKADSVRVNLHRGMKLLREMYRGEK
jgi:RNA polymerase sigma-70 factor (ECF subfamily)